MAVSFIGGDNQSTRRKPWPVVGYWQTLSHNVILSTPRRTRFEFTTLVVICTDCTGSCKSNYHTITTTTALTWLVIFLYFTSRSLPLVLSNMYLNNFFIYFWWVQSTVKTNHLGMNVFLNTSTEEMMILNQIIFYVFIKKKTPLCQQRNDELANIYSYNTFNNMHVWYIFIYCTWCEILCFILFLGPSGPMS